jgi:hypothetical protein
LEDARRLVGQFLRHYNTVRLHSAIGYVTPADKLAGREARIFAQRDQKLAEAREKRRQRRAGVESIPVPVGSWINRCQTMSSWGQSDQPVKQTRALDASNSPAITGRVCDE